MSCNSIFEFLKRMAAMAVYTIRSFERANQSCVYFVSSRERPWRHWRAQGYTLQGASFMRHSRSSFLNAWENTQVAGARWQASSSGIRADVTVVLEVRQSIVKTLYTCFMAPKYGYMFYGIQTVTCYH